MTKESSMNTSSTSFTRETTQSSMNITTTLNRCYTTTSGKNDDVEAWIDDATWILTSSFIIFTMQSGFGLLESGMASRKNEVNIMVKNVVDVVFGGLTYWAIGYGLTFGDSENSNAFTGVGSFFLDPDEEHMGTVFSKFIFQASFCTTATTIVSGAIAERTKLTAYIVFCFLNTLVYSFPAHWVWAPNGWLKQLNVVDVAGVGPVHLVGGVTALVASKMVKPRYRRFSGDGDIVHGNSVNALLGLFILWWGWLGFNCGSTFGISGGKWKLAARSATTTILASCGGGSVAFLLSFLIHKGRFDVPILVNGILGALVSVTGICAVTPTWSAVLIGAIGACITTGAEFLLVRLKIDDPVGASAVHFAGSLWGLLSCGIFTKKDNIEYTFSKNDGLVWGGGFYLLGVQTLAIVSICAWTVVTSSIILKGIDLTIGLRMNLEEELYGADYFEHDIEPSPEVKRHAASVLSKVSPTNRCRSAYAQTNNGDEDTSKRESDDKGNDNIGNDNDVTANGNLSQITHEEEPNGNISQESRTNGVGSSHSQSNGHTVSENAGTTSSETSNAADPSLYSKLKTFFQRGKGRINNSNGTYYINKSFKHEQEE